MPYKGSTVVELSIAMFLFEYQHVNAKAFDHISINIVPLFTRRWNIADDISH